MARSTAATSSRRGATGTRAAPGSRRPGARGEREREPLHALAEACGIHTRYSDGLGRSCTPPAESLLAAIRALGHDISRPGEATRILRALEKERAARICDPVIIAWGGAPPPLHLNLPARTRSFELRLKLEDGGGEYRASHMLARAGSKPLRLPPDLPMGTHLLTIESGSTRAEAAVLSAPTRCYQGDDNDPHAKPPRETGIFIPLYALRSKRRSSTGIGDLSDLETLTGWAGSLGCSLVGTLPLLACYLDEPFDPSPYSPVSRLHFNELFADIARAPELARSPAAQRLLDSAGFKRKIEAIRADDLVDYRAAYAITRQLLQHLAKAAFKNHERAGQIDRLIAEEPTLADYARFRAVADTRRTTWQNWPARLRRGQIKPGDYEENDYRTHIYAQFLMREQLNHQSRLAKERGGRLYFDLPLGAHGGGYDIWRFRDHFATDLATGAPPDVMFTHGQNWGFPPLHPRRSRDLHHAYFTATIRNHLRFAEGGALRIDHVAGLHRLFCIPHGMDGEQGTYIDYPSEDFYAILSIESHRAKAKIIGENLGNVPQEVTDAMHRRGLLGMWVGQFNIHADPRQAVPPIKTENLACLNTHDVPPFAAHWAGLDIPIRQHFGWIDDEQAAGEHQGRDQWRQAVIAYLRSQKLIRGKGEIDVQQVTNALLFALSRSDAEILLINLEDLWAEEQPQNIPGIAQGYPNWRRKASQTLEQITRDRTLADLLRQIARRSRRGGAR